jgi:hypothetical protein
LTLNLSEISIFDLPSPKDEAPQSKRENMINSTKTPFGEYSQEEIVDFLWRSPKDYPFGDPNL